MKKFWAAIGKGLVHAAVWALEHPDKVITVVNGIKAAR